MRTIVGILLAGNGAPGLGLRRLEQHLRGQAAAAAQADINAIDQIEKTWHRAGSTQDIDLMMTVWAPDATFTVGGEPYVARRRFASSSRRGAVPARERLGLGHAGVQDPDHRQRRQGHPVLRVPLHRHGDRQARQHRRRRPGRPEDRRQMADYDLGGSTGHARILTPRGVVRQRQGGLPRIAGSRPLGAPCRAHPDLRPDEAAGRVRADRRPARGRRRPRPPRPRAVERPGRGARDAAAPGCDLPEPADAGAAAPTAARRPGRGRPEQIRYAGGRRPPPSTAASPGCSSTSRSPPRCPCSGRRRTSRASDSTRLRVTGLAAQDPRHACRVRRDARPDARARPRRRGERRE